jgi:hypothetical protein
MRVSIANQNTTLRHLVFHVLMLVVASEKYFCISMCLACGRNRKYSSLEFNLAKRN